MMWIFHESIVLFLVLTALNTRNDFLKSNLSLDRERSYQEARWIPTLNFE